MPFSDAVAVASLYLALVGLLSTFFYIQLGQWLNGILGTDSKWHQVKGRTPESNYFDKRLECYFDHRGTVPAHTTKRPPPSRCCLSVLLREHARLLFSRDLSPAFRSHAGDWLSEGETAQR